MIQVAVTFFFPFLIPSPQRRWICEMVDREPMNHNPCGRRLSRLSRAPPTPPSLPTPGAIPSPSPFPTNRPLPPLPHHRCRPK